MKKIYLLRFLLTVVIAAVFLLGGCTEKLVNDRQNENVQVQMKTTFTTGAAVDEITSFTLTVAAEDIDPTIRVELPLVEGQFKAEVQVPAGRNRIFTLLAFGPDSTILYRGMTVMDVFPSSGDTSPTITIQLSPEVPMVRVTPHFQEYAMGKSFSLEVEVYNLPDLDEIDYEFSHSSRVADLDSVSRPATLDTNAYFTTEIAQQSTGQIAYVYVTQVEQEGTLVDSRGYANLGTFHFSSYTDDILELAYIDILLSINGLSADSAGIAIQIPLEGVTVDDDATVKLLRKTWETDFGDVATDIGYDILETSDGGFVIAGSYNPGEVTDGYLMKIDSLGLYKWGRTFRFSNTGDNGFEAMAPTSDGGFILAGYAYIYGDFSSLDVYLAKADASGILVWDTLYGDSIQNDEAYDVIQASDGGYVISGSRGDSLLLIKTNANGGLLWETTYFNPDTSRHGYRGNALVQTPDGGYLIAGEVLWYNQEASNAFLWKCDAGGTITTDREYLSGSDYKFTDIKMLTSTSFAVTGSYDNDVYLATITPSGDISWEKTYGGPYYDQGSSVARTPDGGYFLVGTLDNYDQGRAYDIYLIKTNASGDTAWTKTFGTYNYDNGHAGIPTSDGGYIATGYVDNYGTTNYDIAIIKTDADGETYVRQLRFK